MKGEKMDTYTAELRIESPSLIPSDVTTILGLQPCQTGDETVAKKDNKRINRRWSYDGSSLELNREREWTSLEEGLLFLLGTLLPKKDLVWLNFGRCDIYWWCGHFQQSFDGGPTFSPELLKKLADFGAQLILSNYFSGEK